MLIHADNRGVDHLDSGIIGIGERVHDTAPHAGPPPAKRGVRRSLSAAKAKTDWSKSPSGEGGRGRELRLGKPRFLAASPARFALPAKISKTTPCKVAGGRWHGCFERSRENILTRRANQRHYSIVAQFVDAHGPAQQRALRRDCRQKSLLTIEIAPARHSE